MQDKAQHIPLLFLWDYYQHPDAATLSYEEWEHVKLCDFCVTRWWACNVSQSIEQLKQRLAQMNLLISRKTSATGRINLQKLPWPLSEGRSGNRSVD